MLEWARRLGFLGPGPVEDHVEHALGFAAAAGPAPGRGADLGSGAGIPGLVLAWRWPASRWLLIESHGHRAEHLRTAAGVLGMSNRVTVAAGRAEEVARHPEHRGALDVVVARGFARPPVTAECGAPLLQVGGCLIVSEPPADEGDRWPSQGLARVGLVPEALVRARGARYRRLRQVEPCPDRYPRRTGVPAKRPLF